MPKQFTVIAHLVAKPERIDEARAFLLRLVEQTRTEAGCVNYDLHQDVENPLEFTFYENWVDRAAWELHNAMPYLQELGRRAPELFAVPAHVRQMAMISLPA